jgi:hypothetical protein
MIGCSVLAPPRKRRARRYRLHVDEDALRPAVVVEVVDDVAHPTSSRDLGRRGAETDVFLRLHEDGGLQRASG